jgi:hypothetical protein
MLQERLYITSRIPKQRELDLRHVFVSRRVKCGYICGRLSHMLLLLVNRLHVMCSDSNNINSVGVEKSGRIKNGLAFPDIWFLLK